MPAHLSDGETNMETVGLVLAGGRAARMGGIDKGLVSFDGEPLVLRAVRRLSAQADRVVVSANRNLDAYAKLLGEQTPVLPDQRTGFCGPLAGLEAALGSVPAKARSDTWIVTVPCDALFFPEDLVLRLQQGLGGRAIAVAETAGRLQPAFQLVRCDQLTALSRFLDEGGRKLGEWVRGAAFVPFPEETAFFNCNTLQDLERAAQGG